MIALAERCKYRGGGYVQCCERNGHAGSHMYKCAGEYCIGLPWIASNTPHPTSCRVGYLSSEGSR